MDSVYGRREVIQGVAQIEGVSHTDSRGSFRKIFPARAGTSFSEISISENLKSGTFRGFHGCKEGLLEWKLIWVIEGRILDFALDSRPDSETFGCHFSTELDPTKGSILLAPGLLHGYLTLTDSTKIGYAMTIPYSKENEKGASVFDPNLDLGIISDIKVISEKDSSWPHLIQNN